VTFTLALGRRNFIPQCHGPRTDLVGVEFLEGGSTRRTRRTAHGPLAPNLRRRKPSIILLIYQRFNFRQLSRAPTTRTWIAGFPPNQYRQPAVSHDRTHLRFVTFALPRSPNDLPAEPAPVPDARPEGRARSLGAVSVFALALRARSHGVEPGVGRIVEGRERGQRQTYRNASGRVSWKYRAG